MINLARQFPAGIQLLNTLYPQSEDNASSPVSALSGIVDGALLFVWNGNDVDGVILPEDAFVEPVLVDVKIQRLDQLGSPYQVNIDLSVDWTRKIIAKPYSCHDTNIFLQFST